MVKTSEANPAGDAEASGKSGLGRILGCFAAIGLLGTLATVSLAWYVYQSTQKPPEFVVKATAAAPAVVEEKGREFESRVFELQNASEEAGRWRVEFSEEQINGWLNSDLPEKFPNSLPSEVTNPAVSIRQDLMQIGFKISVESFSGYVVIEANAFCTEKRNQLGLQIESSKSGVAPIPLNTWADSLTEALRRSEVLTEWTEVDGRPVALMQLPNSAMNDEDRSVELTGVELVPGKLILSGTTETK